jgi:cytochrome c5
LGTNRLLIAAVALIVVGAAGILMTSRFGSFRGDRGGFFPGGGMMPMMRDGGMMGGGGMMGRDRMKEMMKGMMGNMLPHGVTPEELPGPGSPGAKLVTRFCGPCHDIPSPALHTKEEWPGVTGRMFARLSMMSGMPMMRGMEMESPSPDQRKAIVGYLVAHAMKPVSPGGLPQPESAAAVSFKTACSRCHPLPDPKLHTAREWPRVVERMRTHMQEMGKPVVTDAEKDEIAAYLSRNARK